MVCACVSSLCEYTTIDFDDHDNHTDYPHAFINMHGWLKPEIVVLARTFLHMGLGVFVGKDMNMSLHPMLCL